MLIIGLVSSFAEPKKTIDEFLGIRWSASCADAQRQMLTKPGMKLFHQNERVLEFSGGTFLDTPAELFVLVFAGDRFFQADVFYRVGSRDTLYAGERRSVYDKLKAQLVKEYGPPVSSGKDGLAGWKLRSGSPANGAVSVELEFWKNDKIRVAFVNQTEKGGGNTPAPK